MYTEMYYFENTITISAGLRVVNIFVLARKMHVHRHTPTRILMFYIWFLYILPYLSYHSEQLQSLGIKIKII